MEICLINDSEQLVWDGFLDKVDYQPTVYHRYGWRKVFEEAYKHKTYYLVAKEAGKIVGVLPLVHIKNPFFVKNSIFRDTLISLPYLNYVGPCALGDSKKDVEVALIAKAQSIATNLKSGLLLRRVGDGNSTIEEYDYATLILSLPSDSETCWKSFLPKVRNQIRKAEKNGLEVFETSRIDDFYLVYSINVHRLGTPAHSRRFFTMIQKYLCDYVRVFIVKKDEQVVAGMLYLVEKQYAGDPWAATLVDYNKFCPSHLMYWHALKYSIENGASLFDFGRSTVNTGTFLYKKQWGANPHKLYYINYPVSGEPNELHSHLHDEQTFTKLWSRLPYKGATLIGKFLRPYIV